MYICIYMCMCIYVYINMCVCVCVCIYVCVCLFVYIYIYRKLLNKLADRQILLLPLSFQGVTLHNGIFFVE